MMYNAELVKCGIGRVYVRVQFSDSVWGMY